jgi:hypothetical protein
MHKGTRPPLENQLWGTPETSTFIGSNLPQPDLGTGHHCSALGGLDADMAEQELNLFKLSA